MVEKFEHVRKAFFSLHSFGMKSNGLNIYLQAYIYKSYCLSRITYSLENMRIDKKYLNEINIMQNTLLRYLLRLNRTAHMSSILKALRLFKFNELYYKHKLSFMQQLKNNEFTNLIYNAYFNSKYFVNDKSTSFFKDIENITEE